jgi:hypothetical protein
MTTTVTPERVCRTCGFTHPETDCPRWPARDLAAEVTVWQSRTDDTPADLAALYRRAAEIIRVRGYDPYDDYEQATGISMTTALNLAAAGHVTDPRDVADLAEELETRLAGVLYVTGQAFYRTGIRDLSDTAASWERASVRVYASTKLRSRTQAEATAVLELAAAMLGILSGAQL